VGEQAADGVRAAVLGGDPQRVPAPDRVGLVDGVPAAIRASMTSSRWWSAATTRARVRSVGVASGSDQHIEHVGHAEHRGVQQRAAAGDAVGIRCGEGVHVGAGLATLLAADLYARLTQAQRPDPLAGCAPTSACSTSGCLGSTASRPPGNSPGRASTTRLPSS
jgi:hypothetical protein